MAKKCWGVTRQLGTDKRIFLYLRSMPSPFGKRFYVLASEKLSDLGNSAAFYSVLVE